MEKIKSLQKDLKVPILFITHNLEEAFQLADRLLILHGGKIQQFGTLDEIFYHPENLHVAELIGLSNIFNDARLEEYEETTGSAVLKSEDLKIQVKTLNFKPKSNVSWGIHPENITLLLPDSGSEAQDENIYPAYIQDIISKGSKKKITVKLAGHSKILTAEIPAQFIENLKLKKGDSCLAKIEISKVVVF